MTWGGGTRGGCITRLGQVVRLTLKQEGLGVFQVLPIVFERDYTLLQVKCGLHVKLCQIFCCSVFILSIRELDLLVRFQLHNFHMTEVTKREGHDCE